MDTDSLFCVEINEITSIILFVWSVDPIHIILRYQWINMIGYG